MRPLVVVRRTFDASLTRLGFARSSEPPYRYTRRSAIGQIQVFDIEKERWYDRLHFTLAEHDLDGTPVRSIDLCDFENLPPFSYTDERSLSAVVEAALHQFVTYGERWLSGEDVVTPAIEKRRAEHRRFTQERLVGEARELFKAGSLTDAAIRFAEAAEYGPLDEVSRKMLDIALARGGGG